jgi:uncharacterized integral membrane protein
MQLTLIVGIVIAIGAVLFALQNNTPVAVVLAAWRFDGSLALVLLLAVGLGVLIAGLLSSPAVIRGQWAASRLRRQVAELEQKLAEQERNRGELAMALASAEGVQPQQMVAAAPAEKSYVGLRTLLAGGGESTQPSE